MQGVDDLRARGVGSAGYGDPLGRDPAAVARDVAEGSVTAQTAEGFYGVVLGARGGRHRRYAASAAGDPRRAAGDGALGA